MSPTAAPRVVITHRPTEWEQLVARHGTAGQVRFFLETRERDAGEVLDRHQRQADALMRVDQAIPSHWRRSRITRSHLPSFLFEPDDVVVAVGQDGLVPNVAKYLDGQKVIGVNADPDRHEGTLVRVSVPAVSDLLADIEANRARIETRTMVEAQLDDGQKLIALNEIYVGHQTHQSARYVLHVDATHERQSSSGLLISTGTGASGWTRSIATQRRSEIVLPEPGEARLAFFVREAWPSVASGATITEGIIDTFDRIRVTSEMEHGGVAFGDGIEADHLDVGWGQEVMVGIAPARLYLVSP
jgi:hypothetical protein